MTTEGGCYVPLSHKLNQDGYFRYRWPWGAEMFHRTVWRLLKGEIPEGFEIDHECGNRACSNIEHLRCLPRREHLVKTNRDRYAERREAARQFWLTNRITGTALGERFGVSFSRACAWIREWKQQTH